MGDGQGWVEGYPGDITRQNIALGRVAGALTSRAGPTSLQPGDDKTGDLGEAHRCPIPGELHRG